MSFMDSLAQNPSGNSRIYNQGAGRTDSQELDLVNQLKTRDMQDFKDKANFMSDLSLKQERLRHLYDPQQQPQQQGTPAPINNQAALPIRDPNAMTANQTAEMGFKQKQLDQSGKLGQEAIDVKTAQEKLNQQKSDSIHDQKLADSKAKADQATAKLKEEHDKLIQSGLDHAQHATFLKAKADADLARRDLEHAQIDAKHAETKRMDDAKIADYERRANQAGNKTTTTTLNPDGTSKTVKTTTGGDAKMVRVQGKDGTFGTIPADKLDEWNANHAHPNQPPPALAGPQSGGSDSDEDDSSESGR